MNNTAQMQAAWRDAQDLATDHTILEAHEATVGGDPLDSDQRCSAAQDQIVTVDPLAPTSSATEPILPPSGQPSAETDLYGGHLLTCSGVICSDRRTDCECPCHAPTRPRESSGGDHPQGANHVTRVVANSLATDHGPCESQKATVGGESSGDDQDGPEAHGTNIVANPSVTDHHDCETHGVSVGGGTPWHELRAWAEQFSAVQQFRIAAENKVRAANVDAGMFAAQLDAYKDLEHKTDLALGRCYRRVVPAEIKEWQKLHPGLGVHLIALLLGHLGNPAVAIPGRWEGTGSTRVLVHEDPRPRTLGQLWQYCGVGDSTKRKAKGMTAEELAGLGNPQLKMLVYLLATKCMMARTVHGGRYGDLYDLRRLVTADRVHAADCVRCGPSGKPALAGSTWSKAHQHADALRIVGKEILRDLWLISRTAGTS